MFVGFGTACLAGVSITGALLDRFPHALLTTAVATQAVGMLGLYAAGTDPVAAVVFLVLMGGALGPVFMTTQNAMLHCAPGRTDIALAANSGSYNAEMRLAPRSEDWSCRLPTCGAPSSQEAC